MSVQHQNRHPGADPAWQSVVKAPASHRGWRCAGLARRDEKEYRQYSTPPNGRPAQSCGGCSASRLQAGLSPRAARLGVVVLVSTTLLAGLAQTPAAEAPWLGVRLPPVFEPAHRAGTALDGAGRKRVGPWIRATRPADSHARHTETVRSRDQWSRARRRARWLGLRGGRPRSGCPVSRRS